MTIADVIKKELIKIPVVATTKTGVIEELIDLLVSVRPNLDRDELVSAVLARETLGSTGLVDGIAIPHAKTAAVDSIALVVGIAKEPIEFDSQDGKGSQFFFLVLAPEQESRSYIEVLASIARATNSSYMRRLLAASESADDVLALFFN